MSKPFSFKIGADPEFTIMCGIKVASACNTIPILVKENKDCVKEDMGYAIKKHGNIGWDGSSATGEIRPSPSNDIQEVVDNIRELFSATTKKINIFQLSTLSLRQSIGGHIHLELKEEHKENTKTQEKVARALSSFYLPLMLGENMVSLNLRWSKNSSYGDLLDYRYENGKTLEYRCPSAEWLTTPKVAYSTLAYFGVVYNEIIKNPDEFTKKYKDVIIKSKEQSKGLQTLVLSNSAEMIKSLFDKINRHIKDFELYKDFEQEIKFITSPKAVIAEKKKHNYDIISGWNLKGKQPTKRALINQKEVDKRTKSIDLERLSELVPISHNGDLNTEVFANEIKKRVIALNWTPQKRYYIFGLRQGVDNYLIFDKAGQIYTGKEIIKTEEDANFVNELFLRMDNRFSHDGRSRNDLDKYIIIGVPYEKRQKISTTEFIKHILDIESGKLKGEKIRRAELLAKNNKNLEKPRFQSVEDLEVSRLERENIMESEEDATRRQSIMNERIDEIQNTLEKNNKITN